MGIVQVILAICGILGIFSLFAILLYLHFYGWTWPHFTNYLFSSSDEENIVLTKSFTNGCMIPSDSAEFTISEGESFRRFDKTDQDYHFIRQGESCSSFRKISIPPQPLRPAPIPPNIGSHRPSLLDTNNTVHFPTRSGGSSDATTTVLIQQPHQSSHQFRELKNMNSFSNNNPFLPLIQASTQFLSQKFQSFQNCGTATTNPTPSPIPPSLPHSTSTSTHRLNGNKTSPRFTMDEDETSIGFPSSSATATSTLSTGSIGGLSMGEIIFSSPPAHSLPSSSLISQGSTKPQNGSKNEESREPSGVVIHNDPVAVAERGHHILGQQIDCCVVGARPTPSTHKPLDHHLNSPTRIRDRQRKTELTLQHINQEDRIMSKKHYNPDSHYPVSTTPYSPKICSDPGGNVLGAGAGGDKQQPTAGRHRSLLSLRSVPTVKEADETFIESPPPIESIKQDKKSEFSKNLQSLDLNSSSNKWILESMREEIRIENERMEDATKSLMMEDDFSVRKNDGVGGKSVVGWNNGEQKKVLGVGGNQQSHGNILDDSKANMNFHLLSNMSPLELELSNQSNPRNGGGGGGGGGSSRYRTKPNHLLSERAHSYTSPISPLMATPSFRNTRSFSLRQSSTDSVGSIESDSGSPDGPLPSLQRAMSCDSVSSDTSVFLGDPPHPTGYLCVGLEYDW